MIDWLWDLHQEGRIVAAQDTGSDASRKTADLRDRMQFLEDRIDRLLLTNIAMWSLLRDSMGLTDQDLVNKIQQIDLQDGLADGKVSRSPATCPQCKRTFAPRHRRCLYCGHERAGQTPADAR
jgi:hypothetical protein